MAHKNNEKTIKLPRATGRGQYPETFPVRLDRDLKRKWGQALSAEGNRRTASQFVRDALRLEIIRVLSQHPEDSNLE